MQKFNIRSVAGIALAFLFLMSSPLWAEEGGGTKDKGIPNDGIRVKAGILFTDFHTNIQYDRNNVSGTKLNLGSQLDLENDQAVPFIEAWFGGSFAFNIGYMDTKYEGDVRTNSAITYDGQTIHDGLSTVQIDSRIEYRTVDLAGQYSMNLFPQLRIGVIGGARYFRVKSRLSNQTTGVSESSREETIFPYIGGMVEFRPIKWVSIMARLRGGTYRWEKANIDRGNTLDFEIGVGFNFTSFIGFYVEYRYVSIELTKEDTNDRGHFSSELDGVQFSLIARF